MSVLINGRLYLGAYDLSGYANQLEPKPSVAMKKTTTLLTQGVDQDECGYETFSLGGKLFMLADGTSIATYKSHDIIRAYWKLTDIPLTWCPNGGAVGDLAGSFQATVAECQPNGTVGEFYAATLKADASRGIWVYGAILATGAIVAGGNGAAQLLGAVAATQAVYGALHVLAAAGGTLTVKIQSDDNAGFTSPTDRLSFTAATGKTYQWLALAGPITDTYWRAVWTLPAGSATFVTMAGIR